MPVRSGYGPAVSSGVTTQAAEFAPVAAAAEVSALVDAGGAKRSKSLVKK
jgi:hypothetical protein